jgi:hypothetical protein
LDRSAVVEWGIDEQVGTILLGLKYQDSLPIQTLIIQIEEETSSLAKDGWGMHVEIDEHPFYGGVLDFKYDEVEESIRLTLVPGKHKGIDVLQIEIPRPLNENQRQLLLELAKSYDYSLRRHS